MKNWKIERLISLSIEFTGKKGEPQAYYKEEYRSLRDWTNMSFLRQLSVFELI
jgi:hypothetical protein